MPIKFVYKICPVLVQYTKNPIKGFTGMSYGVFIKIHKASKDDEGLLAHELTHSRQFYRTLGVSAVLYFFKKWKYKYELEAYKVQLTYAPLKDRGRLAEKFAGFIADRYGLNVAPIRAKSDLLT